MKDYKIAPSILSADFSRLGEDVKKVIDAGADMIHFDVMDNHYVPNLTFGPMICESLRKYGITSMIDVHLMIKPVDRIIPDFAKAGANYITFHPEATDHLDRTINLIKDNGCKPGIVLNPATPVSYLEHCIGNLDMILLMSVNPGFPGQKFINGTLEKISSVRHLIDNSEREIRLEVDGGINLENIDKVAKAGADTFVAGSAIFNSDNYKKTITSMREVLSKIK
ncbi:MAG: ribulose-phosphate 3-epimerase [Gammaproteobacteria bacterium]|jgi:ribulose-phosphate 3-epimerase|nr:ribulose-phosphate 3-epimerase [Gammaproteobacteria bacterium]MBT4462231.1 ribulose-phosphate 3-epimerase [Gammaproteobacteria bacterium]MBT5117370.1 ribulose-phosphate 3-epimerase [Gammaproteobacteria bacterium]MBT5761975.1 ribulose-phosphate 3-epimerase [Gammaproteobacteria bacterium]MBT6331778.1 ribulose-phosphate 3-epimerase [Gammaproteobacteria bacterium]